ncbi:MAG TPA: PDZ domain-containing protein, partial [Longimicrobiaceae bacterium]|nr:PDZ domain-containing protein [Longimicrobiaceae bacterium]
MIRIMKRIPTRAACSLLGLVLLPALAVAQEVGRIDRERGRTMLRQLRGEIERHYYDPAFRGVDLEARAAELETRIDTARSLAEVLASVAQLALHFGDSHTFFVPPQQTVRVDYGWQMLMVGDSTCFVARVEPGSDAAGQGVKPGDRVLSVNGYRPTRRNLWQILYLFHLLRPQPGLRVVLESPAGEQRQLDLAAEVRQRFRVADLTGADGGGDLYRLIREAQEDQRELE